MPNKYLDSEGLAEYTGLVKSALNLKADLASPALTGTPTAPTPAVGDDSTKIATTEFVNDKADNYLPLNGGTLTGNVYTTPYYDSTIVDPEGGQTLIVSKGKVAKGTAPSNDEWHTMVMAVDNSGLTKNANKYGQVETAVKTDGSVETAVQAYKNEANSTTSAKISVGYDANGNAFTSAPTPTAGDNSTKIATTAFVNTKASDYLPLSGGTMTGNLRISGDKLINIGSDLHNAGRGGWIAASGSGLRIAAEQFGISQSGAILDLNGRSYASSPGTFTLKANSSAGSKDLIGTPNGALTWNGWSVMEQAYAVQLDGSGAGSTYTFHMQTNLAVIFAMRGNNASIYMVDTWSNPIRISLNGTDPITVTKVSNNNITITNVNGSAVVLKILNGGAL